MSASRRDEAPKTWFRSDRIFMQDNGWFFHTREGVDIGPYESQFEAQIESGLLKELLTRRGDQDAMKVIRDFVLDSYAMGRPLSPSFAEAQVG